MSKKNDKFAEEGSYKTTVKFKCPVRGMVEQEVFVRKFTPVSTPEMKSTDAMISDLLNIEEVDELE